MLLRMPTRSVYLRWGELHSLTQLVVLLERLADRSYRAGSKSLGVAVEIDYENTSSPNLSDLQAFVSAYRSQIPYDATGNNPAARLVIDLGAPLEKRAVFHRRRSGTSTSATNGSGHAKQSPGRPVPLDS